MGENRKYKDSMFTALYKDKKDLISLYNALSGENLPLETAVEIATLEDVLFNYRQNDIAFVLGGKIVILVEHQSTICENMPLRLFIYLARVYEKLVEIDAVYKRKQLKIPKPDFIVLYNGMDEFPDEKTLRLSSAYHEAPPGAHKLGGFLELEVRVVNINEGRNVSMINKCETLKGYVHFVETVRANQKRGMELKEAITKGAESCIEKGILKKFLTTHSSEVINMLTTEWDIERARKVWEEEGREEGIEVSAKIIREYISGKSVEQIGAVLEISVDDVRRVVDLFESA